MEALANHHLKSRKGVWYYCRRVPREVETQFGRKVIDQSLRTGDEKQARKQRNLLDVRYDMEFQALLAAQQSELSSAPANGLASLSYEEFQLRVAKYITEEVVKTDRRMQRHPATSKSELRTIIEDKELELQTLADPDHPDQHLAIDRASPFDAHNE